MTKRRITVTLDEDLVAAANAAVQAGRADSVSAWVNEALSAHRSLDARKAAFDEALAEYEAEHGVITEEAMAERERADLVAAEELRRLVEQMVRSEAEGRS